ncbi:hypothetical protein LAZ67_15002938 [Cordylochernes scorpioides]|uniref:Retrovirus-related Pol polyprotein from transposon TNT 1-94 n=1 Tax=Cordylochernes scorpioides TaxID=51811 RepID=A0ABY6L9X7_9ARAC|nr:hypothetical protein LAZ67_15002938 [Cordylochernes scorpioides]
MENTTILMKPDGKAVVQISSIYKKPDLPFQEEDLNLLLENNQSVIAAGDWNSKHPLWGSRTSNNSGTVLHNFSEKENLDIVAPSSPTHYSPLGNPDFLDIAILRNIPWTSRIKTLDALSSDHLPVILELTCPKDEFTTRACRLTNWVHFQQDLISSTPPRVPLKTEANIDSAVTILNDKIYNSYSKHTVISYSSSKQNPSTKALIKEKNKARKRWQATWDPAHRAIYLNLQGKVNKALKSDSTKNWNQFIHKIESSPKDFWRKMKPIRKKTERISSLVTNGKTLLTDKEIGSELAEHFSNQFSKEKEEDQPNITYNHQQEKMLTMTTPNEVKEAGIFIGETNAKTVWDELKRIHTGNIEDKIIDIGLEMKNIQMRNNEGIEAYITRARNIASRSANLGQPISPREMVYHVVRAEIIYSSSHLPEEDAHIWNLDSGCTSHMSPREDWLINKIPIDSEINLAEEERFIKAEAQGDVKLSTYTSEDFFQITLTMGSTPEELNTPDNPETIPESSGLPKKPGRIAGRTNEDIQAKHLINLQEQEERLRASGVRRSERIKERNAANVTELSSTSINIPKTYREAMNTPFSDQWKEAMEEEFHSLTSHNVWTLVPKPENENLIKGKWIFNIKMNPDGSIDKRKARFVAMGHNQKPGVDYEESFAPVMKLDSLRTLIAIASQQNMKIEQYDVKTAYLNAELKDDVYLEQPEGFVQAGQENKVCKLNRSLYGLPQSRRCWNEKINQIFNDIGLRRLESEPCAYILQEEEKTLIIGIYVDDFLIIGSDSTIINRIVKQLDKQIVIVRKEKPIFFLGIKIEEKENCFELSQEAYVEKILKKFNLEECNPVKTPGKKRCHQFWFLSGESWERKNWGVASHLCKNADLTGEQTISRRLVANGLHSCRPLRRLPLTPPNRRQRLEWCRARSTWMTEWHRVVFSDESRFCLSSDSRRVRVWRRRGERSNPAAIVERPTVRQRGIMVWGAIAYDSRSPLLRIQGTMTAQRYVDDVLRPVTLPYLQGVPNALYQQDNARPHTARISQQALQDVQMLPWPPYSPDLSLIEHVWDIIGRRLHALPQPGSEDELWQMKAGDDTYAFKVQKAGDDTYAFKVQKAGDDTYAFKVQKGGDDTYAFKDQ